MKEIIASDRSSCLQGVCKRIPGTLKRSKKHRKASRFLSVISFRSLQLPQRRQSIWPCDDVPWYAITPFSIQLPGPLVLLSHQDLPNSSPIENTSLVKKQRLCKRSPSMSEST